MTLIYFSADNLELLSNIISQELNKLHNWLAVNKLSLNINKTNYMVFGKGRVTSDIAIAKTHGRLILSCSYGFCSRNMKYSLFSHSQQPFIAYLWSPSCFLYIFSYQLWWNRIPHVWKHIK